MASTGNSNPYAYQGAATMATRSLVSNSKPEEAPSACSSDAEALQRETTSHYEQAAAAATKAGNIPATTARNAAASVTERPGAQRQPSWKRSDLKGHQQGQMLANVAGGQGYSSTQK